MRHVMSKNFSIPMSDANPDSVMTYSPSLRPTRSATSELFPWAMFANGPQWTNAGWPSSVCTRFGLIASLRTTASAPAACLSSAVTGSPSYVCPTVMRPSRSRRSARSRATATRPMISLAAVMSKPVSRGAPCARPPRPVTTFRRFRSFMSMQRRHEIASGSRPDRVSVVEVRVDQRGEEVVRGRDRMEVAGEVEVQVLHRDDLRVAAAGRAAFTPKTGPSEASRRHRTGLRPSLPRPCVSETEVVVLPFAGRRRRDRPSR